MVLLFKTKVKQKLRFKPGLYTVLLVIFLDYVGNNLRGDECHWHSYSGMGVMAGIIEAFYFFTGVGRSEHCRLEQCVR